MQEKNKVLLINTNVEKSPYPVPPLGLSMLAVALETEWNVRVYDGVFDEGSNLVELVHSFTPDYIGFSIRNVDDVVKDRAIFYLNDIVEKFIQPVRAQTTVPIILGGSGFSIFPEEIMKMTGADFGIIGEAEFLLPELLHRLSHNLPVVDLPNLLTARADMSTVNHRKLSSRLSFAKFPELDRWIDFGPYRNRGVYSIQTKRGCSHGCIYCTYPLIEGSNFRLRNPADVADEIQQAHQRLGEIAFEFVDSTFNDPIGHAEAICKEIIQRKIKVRLRTMGINPRHCSEELFDLMIRAGFTQIDATPDSASPEILKNLKKGFTLAEIEKMAGLIRKFDMPTMWFFLFGGPGESEDTFMETLDFIDQQINPADLVYMNCGIRVYPGTPLYEIAVKEGRILNGQSVFQPPYYYYSALVGKENLDELIRTASAARVNCIHAMETAPTAEMINLAMQLREKQQLKEPMFRTLLRIRSQVKKATEHL